MTFLAKAVGEYSVTPQDDFGQPFRATRFDADRLATAGEAVASETGAEHVSVGVAMPGYEIDIRDRDGMASGPDRVGRVWVRGPSIMEGYLGRPDDTAAALRDGWLDTGDLGFVHDGELYLTGRAKDVLIIRGRNHAPQDVERACDAVDDVRTGCAIAVSAAERDGATEELFVFVERARDARRPDDDIAADCVEEILAATSLRADAVVVLAPGTLPRTSSGKLRRAEALRQYRAGELRPPEPVNAMRVVRATLRSRRALRRYEAGRADSATGRVG